ncbi:Rpn family recombination-promoting nuclease/putative transposase [Brachyspira innocens]|uniref:Rpn family recombination-promoting nuclease/putative transposase n=1 Tax=Brachyspira innocens TaxID=13264 RepID=A0ABT8YXY2_9SPIR|nr:Rpn family recombination-promoting nuclease/putative transposase [Brachyspira innocens]MDO6993029.1 Rpn family recombination-promoting nuclease/putative transposase [Brachyspira innocens]MDO7020102.1 Rpn family recombination-promoting nuclease/putative transposase [Brachyspira innocens]
MRNINVLNDYFVRYLFSSPDSNLILLDFINSIMLDSNMKTFRSAEILTPFNYKENYEDKETIADVKCITQNGTVVIIEIQLQGNSRFPERILYYWASNYSKLLKHGEKYDALTPVISINLLNFNLDDSNNIHSCYMIYDTINNRLLTDHLQIHIIELKKFQYNLLQPDLNCWLKFFTMKEKDNKELIMSDLVKEKPIEVQKRYNNFIKDRLMMNEYDKREAYLYSNQIMLEEERRLGIEEGIRQGIEKGIEQGEKNKAVSMAKNMKNRYMDLNLISELTGLSIREIEEL